MTNAEGVLVLPKYFVHILWAFGLIIFGVSIAGIADSQDAHSQRLFIVDLVFVIFMGILSLAQIFLMRKSRCMYDVHGNDVENCANSNADNKSYQVSEKQDKSKETIAPKWINKKFFGKKQKKEEKAENADEPIDDEPNKKLEDLSEPDSNTKE